MLWRAAMPPGVPSAGIAGRPTLAELPFGQPEWCEAKVEWEKTMAVLHLDHVNISTAKLAESIAFYGDILGLSVTNPPMVEDMSKGAWAFDERGIAVVHLVGTDKEAGGTEPLRGVAQRGMIDHFALRYEDLTPVRTAMEQHGLSYDTLEVPQIGMCLLFVRDPNGIMVELSAPLAA